MEDRSRTTTVSAAAVPPARDAALETGLDAGPRQVMAAQQAPTASRPESGSPPWTFLSNHAHVLICIAQDPDSRMRDLASKVGITERAVQRIVTELEDAGYLARRREGRRNRYQLSASRPLRHPIERHCATDSLLDLVLGPGWRQA